MAKPDACFVFGLGVYIWLQWFFVYKIHSKLLFSFVCVHGGAVSKSK